MYIICYDVCCLQDLTLAEKMQRYQNFKRTAKIMANPMFTFAACGFAFAAADCSMQNYLGRDSTLNGIVGGIAAGSVLGLKTNSAFNAVKYSALFGGMYASRQSGTCCFRALELCVHVLSWMLCLHQNARSRRCRSASDSGQLDRISFTCDCCHCTVLPPLEHHGRRQGGCCMSQSAVRAFSCSIHGQRHSLRHRSQCILLAATKPVTMQHHEIQITAGDTSADHTTV